MTASPPKPNLNLSDIQGGWNHQEGISFTATSTSQITALAAATPKALVTNTDSSHLAYVRMTTNTTDVAALTDLPILPLSQIVMAANGATGIAAIAPTGSPVINVSSGYGIK